MAELWHVMESVYWSTDNCRVLRFSWHLETNPKCNQLYPMLVWHFNFRPALSRLEVLLHIMPEVESYQGWVVAMFWQPVSDEFIQHHSMLDESGKRGPALCHHTFAIWGNCCLFKQYMPNKTSEYGMKSGNMQSWDQLHLEHVGVHLQPCW